MQLKSIDEKELANLEIPYREINSAIIGENILTPPKILLEWLELYKSEAQKAILKIRKQILSFDECIQELADSKSITYGKGRKLCAEFCFQRKSKEIVLCLWLPILNRKKLAIGRMQIGTKDWSTVWALGHVANGISKMQLGWVTLYFLKIEGERVRGYLDELVDDALKTWLQKF